MRLRLLVLLVVFALGCKDPYTPKVPASNRSYLVVDGFINAGPGTLTQIRLTRTTQVNDTGSVAAVHGARITISQAGQQYNLTESGDSGYYQVTTTLDGSDCKLSIQTVDGKQFESDPIPVLHAPAIDTITHAIKDQGMQIYLDASDPTNTVQYYRWDYDETWEYHSPYRSRIKYDWSKRMLTLRTSTDADSLNNCYQSESSHDILVYSTQALSESKVSKYSIAFVPPKSQKLSDLYSINVRQYALNNAAYNYYIALQKTSKDLGDVFGPLPSQLKSNMHPVGDNSGVVIGYMTASTVTEKRAFIDNYDLTSWGYTFDYLMYPSNLMDFSGLDQALDAESIYYLQVNSPCPADPTTQSPPPCDRPHKACCRRAFPVNSPSEKVLQYAYDTICIDCIFWGKGGRKKPDFWPR